MGYSDAELHTACRAAQALDSRPASVRARCLLIGFDSAVAFELRDCYLEKRKEVQLENEQLEFVRLPFRMLGQMSVISVASNG